MPKRDDIESVLVIGSGPIVIGQACEFDYSGTQACRVLREEGIRVVLVNSNPATIMTDPEFADATYVEPITPEFVEKVIAKERPRRAAGDARRPDGAQHGHPARRGRRPREVRRRADRRVDRGDREGREPRVVQGRRRGPARPSGVPRSRSRPSATRWTTAWPRSKELGYPVVVRPSFTMGGSGCGLAYDEDDLHRIAGSGLALSPTTEVLLEESILGWKEYELEVMRDTRRQRRDRLLDREPRPDGRAHRRLDHRRPGDDAHRRRVPAPARHRDRRHPRGRRRHRRLQHPVRGQPGRRPHRRHRDESRGSRGPSALASKATGFPIAKIAAKVAIGYTLDEIPNDITRETPASFEPTLDYVVVKVPRFAFEKFPAADATLTTHMKSVGEAMAIGRNFTEALQKALRSPGEARRPRSTGATSGSTSTRTRCSRRSAVPHDGRLKKVMDALRAGASLKEIFDATAIDPWFIDQLLLINEVAHGDPRRRRADACRSCAGPSGTGSPTSRSASSAT